MRWIAVFLLVIPSVVVAKPDFHLCSAYVQQAAVGAKIESGWPVHVKLTKVGATSFENFTESNIGSMARLLVGDREFLRATIWGPIPSGDLHRVFSSKEVATAWQRTLVDKLPAAPCGAGD